VPERLLHRAPRATSALAFIACTLPFFTNLPSARADSPSAEATAEARRNEAKAKFEAGVGAYGEGRYEDAVRAFQSADALQPSAPLSFNIARAFERLNNTPAALRWYRDYLRRSPLAANVAEVQTRVTELAAKLAERGVQQLSVLSTPEGATVLIDQQPAGVTPLTTELAPGAHHLSLRAAGYRDAEADFMLEARTARDLVVTLVVPAAEPAHASAPEPRAAEAPAVATRPFGVAPWLVLGTGAASMLGALGFELGRRSAETAAAEAPQRNYKEHFETMEGRQTAARVLCGVGGALLVTGGTLLVLNTPKTPSTKLALGCTGNSCGVVAQGSF
jgi:tetratricopeptide (TPR) repeat protein